MIRPSKQIVNVKIENVKPSPENDLLYAGVNETDPAFMDLVKSVRQNAAILEPLILTKDNFVLSGHRRLAAAKVVGMNSVPARFCNVYRKHLSNDKFLKLLAEFNTQREKSPGERIKETMARIGKKPHHQIIAERLELQHKKIIGAEVKTCGEIYRSEIGPNKQEFLHAVVSLVESLHSYWPISARQVHYRLLNDPPLTNSSKGKQRHRYANDARSAKSLSDLLTRIRIEGLIPVDAIVDETRAEIVWNVHSNYERYLANVSSHFTADYQLDLMKEQPNHIEIIVEKLTVKSYVEEIAAKYCIPIVVARGKCSLPPRHHVVQRWEKSGKDKLILVALADFDPDGIVITDMWHKSLIGDLGVPESKLKVIRAGINKAHVKKYRLPRSLDAKTSSPTFKDFEKKYGRYAYELESLSPKSIQDVLRATIESIIDRPAYDRMVEQEVSDVQVLEAVSNDFAGFVDDVVEYHGTDSG